MSTSNNGRVDSMLAVISMGLPRQSRQLAEEAEEIEEKQHAQKGTCKAFSYYFKMRQGKKVIDGLAPLKTFQNNLKKELELVARYPFIGTAKILPAPLISRFLDRKSRGEQEMIEVRDRWAAEDYNDWALTAPERMGGLYDPEDYPSLAECLESFVCQVDLMPMPEGEQWRRFKDISPTLAAEMEATTNSRVQQAREEARLQTCKDLIAPVQKIVEVCSKDKPRIFDTLITNLTQVLDIAPAYVGNDQDALRFINETSQTLGTIKPDDLRADPALRTTVARNAQQLLSRFGALGARKLA